MVGPCTDIPGPSRRRLRLPTAQRGVGAPRRRSPDTRPAGIVAGRRSPATATPTALLAAVGREGGLPMAVADQVLAALVRVGRDDALAARIALQRVVPGLVRAAVRRTAGRHDRRQRVFDDLVANAWLVIRCYPLERRPAKIAVNVLRDAEYLTCVRPARLRSATERPVAVGPSRATSRRAVSTAGPRTTPTPPPSWPTCWPSAPRPVSTGATWRCSDRSCSADGAPARSRSGSRSPPARCATAGCARRRRWRRWWRPRRQR